jgi:beta-glucosidase
MARLGLLDTASAGGFAEVDEVCPAELETTQSFVREVTCRTSVLLKNDRGTLPLEVKLTRRIAVIGPLADRVHLDWYSGTPSYLVTPLEGIRARVSGAAEIVHVTNNDTSAALRAARWADVCIVCVGNHPTGDAEWAKVTRPSYGKEAVDRRSLELEEERLVKRVFEVNQDTILVLISSFPYAICWSQENLPAIVHLTHNSQELGNALAAVLFGDENPGGRLVQTWPRSLAELPPLVDYDITRGRTHMYFVGEPLYPFGFGLSYTRFEYSKLRAREKELRRNAPVAVDLTLKNAGDRAGDDVVQLYASFPGSKVDRPKQKLVAFQRVRLRPGESRKLTFWVEARELEYWDETAQARKLEAGRVSLKVCRSASDVVLEESIDVKAA